jgi:hypothetical protein
LNNAYICYGTDIGATALVRREDALEKVSGRWGFRPLGRGDGGKRNPKLFLTSRHHAALASSTTAHGSSRNRPGSRDQLPITVAIVLRSGATVDSSVVPSHPVLSALCFRTVSQVPWYRWPAQSGMAISRKATCQAIPSKFVCIF